MVKKLLKCFLFLLFFTQYSILHTQYSIYAQDKIVAIVNNDIITQKDLNDFINFMRIQLSSEYQGEKLESKIQSMRVDLLDKLIEDRLILQEARKKNIKIDENKIKAKIDELKKRYTLDSEFQEALTKQGLSQADIELRIREQLLMYSIIDSEVRSKILVNPTEVTDCYHKNIEDFNLSEGREFDSISINDENKAFEVSNKLKKGEGLQDLINKYSLPVNKLTVTKKGELRKEIEDIIFKLKPGEISGPVKIQDTFYIFKLNNTTLPRQQSLSEVQDEICAFLYEKKMQERLAKWLEEIKKNAYIKIFPT